MKKIQTLCVFFVGVLMNLFLIVVVDDNVVDIINALGAIAITAISFYFLGKQGVK
jgi:peptidoglycan biosynthesis protein MviN/MurJ (putative lipid II flippase)